MRIARCLSLVVLVVGINVGSAQAALITLNANFSAAGFPGMPVDPVTGTFSVTFDNTTNVNDVMAGVSLTNLNITLGSAPAFDYQTSGDQLIIGGVQNTNNAVLPGTNDISLLLFNVSTNPTL